VKERPRACIPILLLLFHSNFAAFFERRWVFFATRSSPVQQHVDRSKTFWWGWEHGNACMLSGSLTQIELSQILSGGSGASSIEHRGGGGRSVTRVIEKRARFPPHELAP
jgi:hypothetical protein